MKKIDRLAELLEKLHSIGIELGKKYKAQQTERNRKIYNDLCKIKVDNP
jgi:hypothetical protein